MQNFNFIEKLVSGVNRETGKNYTLSEIICTLCAGVMFLFVLLNDIRCYENKGII